MSSYYQKIINYSFKYNNNISNNEFLDAIEKYKITISGSFILQCLFNENYETDIDLYKVGNQLDIYDENSDFYKFLKFLGIDNKYFGTNCKGSSGEGMLPLYHGKYESLDIMLIKRYQEARYIEPKHGEIMELRKRFLKELYYPTVRSNIEDFDIDACKVYYDPETKKVNIYNFNALIKKISYYDYIDGPKSLSVGYSSFYCNRNCFSREVCYCNTVYRSVLDRTNWRVEKYTKRGFILIDKSDKTKF
jgi:hypothetical protein